MKDKDTNRQNMHRTVLETLLQATYRTVWQNKRPQDFTNRVSALQSLVEQIEALAQQQERDITGHAEDKEREELELEDQCIEISAALSEYYRGKGSNALAAEIYLSPSGWRVLRDESLLTHARNLYLRLDTAIGADAMKLDTDYGLAAADLVALQKETDDYAALVVSPSAAIAQRKAHTQTLPPLFRQANLTLAGMDRLIKRFRSVAGGPELLAAYQAARIIRDAGHRPGATEEPVV